MKILFTHPLIIHSSLVTHPLIHELLRHPELLSSGAQDIREQNAWHAEVG